MRLGMVEGSEGSGLITHLGGRFPPFRIHDTCEEMSGIKRNGVTGDPPPENRGGEAPPEP